MFTKILSISFLFLVGCTTPRQIPENVNSTIGKCYSKCIVAKSIMPCPSCTVESFTMEVYTGDNVNVSDLKLIKASDPLTYYGYSETLKKYMYLPSKEVDYYVLLKTDLIKEFKIENVNVTLSDKDLTIYEELPWVEILCPYELGNIIHALASALSERGYYELPLQDANDIKPKNIVIDGKLKAAVIKYQKDNNLAIGEISFETIKHLGIQL